MIAAMLFLGLLAQKDAASRPEQLVDHRGWGIEAPKRRGCTAMEVEGERSGSGAGLVMRPEGKTSHACDEPTHVWKLVEFRESTRLRFSISNEHRWGEKSKVTLAVMDERGTERLWERPIATDKEDRWKFEVREVSFVVPAPRRVRLVIETTCRTRICIQDVSATKIETVALGEETRAKIDAAVPRLADGTLDERDAAQGELGKLLVDGARVRLEVLEALRARAAKTTELEAAGRLRDVIKVVEPVLVELK